MTLATRAGDFRRFLPAVAVALTSLLILNVPTTSALQGTPAAVLHAPTPEDCTVEPRSEDNLRALFREVEATPISAAPAASPTPAAAPAGAPADEQTVAEVTATWRQYLACVSAGDQARMFAVFSDAMVRRQLAVDIAFGVTEEALFAFLEATPVPLPADQFVPFEPFKDVRVLADGRVAVVGPGDGGRGDVRIFVREGDRWLIDDWFELT